MKKLGGNRWIWIVGGLGVAFVVGLIVLRYLGTR